MNVPILTCLKEELSWAIDKWLRLVINTMLFKTVISLKNKAVFNLKNIVCVAICDP